MSDATAVTGFLHRQYISTIDMLRGTIEACPDAEWVPDGEDRPFWHEAYHAVMWLDNLLGDSTKRFQKKPFGLNIDPRLAVPSEIVVSKDQLLGFLEQVRTRCDEAIPALTLDELAKPNRFGIEESVGDMLINSMRHGQHHVGRLRLRLPQIGFEPEWV
jgi:hypothetical protein